MAKHGMCCCSPLCSLRGNDLGTEGAAALAVALPQCAALQRLEYVRESQHSGLTPRFPCLCLRDNDMSVFLVEFARCDVLDEDIVIDFASTGKMGWKASMDEIPSVVRAVANSVVESMRRSHRH